MEMIAVQMPAELKRARADYVIDNSGSLTALNEQVEQLWQSLRSLDSPVFDS
jgi:dephospho-CoA kinase